MNKEAVDYVGVLSEALEDVESTSVMTIPIGNLAKALQLVRCNDETIDASCKAASLCNRFAYAVRNECYRRISPEAEAIRREALKALSALAALVRDSEPLMRHLEHR